MIDWNDSVKVLLFWETQGIYQNKTNPLHFINIEHSGIALEASGVSNASWYWTANLI